MQAKDREITLLQRQLGEKVSHEWYTLNSLAMNISIALIPACECVSIIIMCGNYKNVSKNCCKIRPALDSKATKIA